MIPEGVDIDDLSLQLAEDSVAFDAVAPAERIDSLEPGLIDAVTHAGDSGFGSLGVVVLTHTPAHTPDLRDVAQDLLLGTDLETVIVRAPGSGAMVSEVHSRGALESAQHPFLANPDVVGGVFGVIDDVNGWSTNWPFALAAMVAALAVLVLATGWSAWKKSSRRA
ncbi:DUF6676 family protein [Corynebacterium sp.]|uniref:Rv1476 family membrane protein n=1 Tax=Corynebacterium sp. TaxID=1720 RepID=UPI0026DFEBF3|nr:DUF6676 family protein [Corynebacterium sp.]MDO5511114.1 hypothetical protein [Corynebacterium sp.]